MQSESVSSNMADIFDGFGGAASPAPRPRVLPLHPHGYDRLDLACWPPQRADAHDFAIDLCMRLQDFPLWQSVPDVELVQAMPYPPLNDRLFDHDPSEPPQRPAAVTVPNSWPRSPSLVRPASFSSVEQQSFADPVDIGLL